MSGPQAFVVQNDSTIVWDSLNLNPGGIAVERWYPDWTLEVSPWDAAWVWNNAGAAPVGGGGNSVERWYPDWNIRCSPWDEVFVWNNTGTTESVAASVAPAVIISLGAGGEFTWKDHVLAKFRFNEAKRELELGVRREKRLVKEKAKIEKQLERLPKLSSPPEGVLASYWKVSEKLEDARRQVFKYIDNYKNAYELFKNLDLALKQKDADDEDERDIEMLLLS